MQLRQSQVSEARNSPKINNGSSAILTSAPTICAIIGVFMSPLACKNLCPDTFGKQSDAEYADDPAVYNHILYDFRGIRRHPCICRHKKGNRLPQKCTHNASVSGVPIPPYSFAFLLIMHTKIMCHCRIDPDSHSYSNGNHKKLQWINNGKCRQSTLRIFSDK